jgi:hypothetical protein
MRFMSTWMSNNPSLAASLSRARTDQGFNAKLGWSF